MDLGINGRSALVCAASKGLGKACAISLAREGVSVTITARTRETLEATADEIRRETGAKVLVVVGDIATPEGRAAAFRCRDVADDHEDLGPRLAADLIGGGFEGLARPRRDRHRDALAGKADGARLAEALAGGAHEGAAAVDP